MKNSFLKKNLLLLKKKDSALFELISSSKVSKFYSTRNSKSGFPSLIHVDKYGQKKQIDSIYNPIKESQCYLESLNIDGSLNFIVLGLGLGYQVSEIIRQTSDYVKIYIFEKDPELFALAIRESDLTLILEHPGVNLFVGVDPLSLYDLMGSELINFTLNEYCLVKQKALIDKNVEYYGVLFDEIEKYFKENKINFKTQSVHSKLYYKNIFANLTSLKDSPGINCLKDRLVNIPAVICSAGPSLDKNIQLLKSARDRFFLVAVSTALKPLLNNGIKPDIVISIDPDELSIKSFDLLNDLSNTLLVYNAAVPSIIPSSFIDKKIAFDLDFYLAQWFKTYLGVKGSLGKIFSVAHSAFNLAQYLSCSPIILVGQDLSFHKHRLHCLHSFYQDENMCLISKFKPLYYLNYLKHLNYGVNLIQCIDIFGFQVTSTIAMNSYNHIFSSNLDNSCSVVNATEGGVAIKGIKNLSLREALFYYCKKSIRHRCDSLMDSIQIKHPSLKFFRDSVLVLIQNLENIAQKAHTIKMKYPDEPNSGHKQLFVDDMRDFYKYILKYKDVTLLIQDYDFAGFADWYRSNSQILNKKALSQDLMLINEEFERDYKFLDSLLNSVEYLQVNLKNIISL
jgi:hypothetical protein